MRFFCFSAPPGPAPLSRRVLDSPEVTVKTQIIQETAKAQGPEMGSGMNYTI
jgi:hypothetical protein